MTKTDKATKGEEALYTLTIDGAESAPMTLEACEEGAADYNDSADEIAIHTYPEGKLVKQAKKTKPAPAKKTKPAKAAAKKPAKAVKTAKAGKAVKATKAAKPAKASDKDSMVDQVISLASRAKGATADELNTLTEWKGAPWKWLFSNPKGTGWCDRRGLKFQVLTIPGKEGERSTKAYKVG